MPFSSKVIGDLIEAIEKVTVSLLTSLQLIVSCFSLAWVTLTIIVGCDPSLSA